MAVEGFFEPLPEAEGEFPVRRGKFIDVEVYGNLFAATGTFTSVTIDDATITDATISGTTTINDATINNATITNADIDSLAYDKIVAGTNPNTLTHSGDFNVTGSLGLSGDLTMGAGGVFRTDDTGTRVEMTSAAANSISLYSGGTAEQDPAIIYSAAVSTASFLEIQGPTGGDGEGGTNYGQGLLTLASNELSSPDFAAVDLRAEGTGNWDARTSTYATTDTGDATLALSASSTSSGAADITITASSTSGASSIYAQGDTIRLNSDQVFCEDGTAALPSISFNADQNTGLYRYGADAVGAATNGTHRWRVQTPTSDGNAYLRNSGVVVVVAPTLGGTAGNITRAMSWYMRPSGNAVNLEVQAVRETTGSDHTGMAVGFRRITDNTSQSSLWFTRNGVIVNSTEDVSGIELAVNGQIANKPTTTGSTNSGQWVNVTGSWYEWRRNTSTRRHKFDIDYDPKWAEAYANVKLPPLTRHGRIDADTKDERFIGWIAEDLHKAEPRLVNLDEGGLPESPDLAQIVMVLAAKIERLEAALNV